MLVTREVRLCASLLDFLGGRVPFELMFERFVEEALAGAVEFEEVVWEDVTLEIDIRRMVEGYNFNGVGLRTAFGWEGA